jgi:SnoaL-like domain
LDHDLPAVRFLCVHNAARSQIALGWFTHLAGSRAVAWSGGPQPIATVDQGAVAAMAEIGINISEGFSEPWTDEVLLAAASPLGQSDVLRPLNVPNATRDCNIGRDDECRFAFPGSLSASFALPQIFTDDVLYQEVGFEMTFHGHEGVRQYFRRVLLGIPDFTEELTKVIDVRPAVIVAQWTYIRNVPGRQDNQGVSTTRAPTSCWPLSIGSTQLSTHSRTAVWPRHRCRRRIAPRALT